MTLEISLKKATARIALMGAAAALFCLLSVLIISNFITGIMADERIKVNRGLLASTIIYFPNSARLQARLAQVELAEPDRDLSVAEAHARRAIALLPDNYKPRLLLASIEELKGDRDSAELSLREAVRLAPHNREVHYRLANLLLREGKLDESVEEFRLTTEANPSLLPATLDLVWRATGGDTEAVKKIAGTDVKARLALAQFLVNQSRADDAATVFDGLDRSTQMDAPETAPFLNSLIAKGEGGVARRIWGELLGGSRTGALVSNGGFEDDILKNFDQFDWAISRSEYARILIDTRLAHGGTRSLKIDFTGRDTTRLDNEIRQLVMVNAGVRYRLECYARTEELVTPEGPRVVVTDKSNNWLASSAPLASGTSDWQRIAIEFAAPSGDIGDKPGGQMVYISIKRKPEFSYDDPTRGSVWFDDFLISRQ